jgi:flagellar biosynthesis/type III secretory pathway chaperone
MFNVVVLKDTDVTGIIELTKDSFVRPEKNKKSKFTFAVSSPKRVFIMHTDNQTEMDEWIKKISEAIEKLKRGNQQNGIGNFHRGD